MGFRTLEHNQAKLCKFPGLHLQRSVDNVSSSYLFRLFVYGLEAMELIRIETRGLWGSVSLSGKFGRRKCFVRESKFTLESGQIIKKSKVRLAMRVSELASRKKFSYKSADEVSRVVEKRFHARAQTLVG